MPKGLFIILGAGFRTGNQGSTIIGRPESYAGQKEACMTHIGLFKHLKREHDSDIDVILNTYSTQYDNDIQGWYDNYLISSQFHKHMIGYHELYRNSVDLAKPILDKYDYVHFLRADLFLKPHFYGLVTLDDHKFKYSSICFTLHNYHKTSNNLPRVADMMLYIPKVFFSVLLLPDIALLSHYGVDALHAHGVCVDNVSFYLHTYHDSDSYKDWNPIYYVVNREQNKTWHSEGYMYNPLTGEPEKSDINYEHD